MTNTLKSSYQKTPYKLSGNGPRNISVLKEAFQNIDENLESDIYGNGAIIEDFQTKIAKILGKEEAVFFPSGTMAQQIALRIWADRKDNRRMAYHPLSHLEIHEQDGLKELQQINPILLGTAERLLTIEDIKALQEPVSSVLLELPQREIGGQLPSFEELEEISQYCKAQGIALHLDGARLWEITPFYEKSAEEICALFDSVYVSFYKGIGAIAGAILAGDADFVQEAKIWKRRYGGDLISLYPYILSADYYFDKRIGKMASYYAAAKKLAERFNACDGVKTVPEVPVSNMFHVHFEKSVDVIGTKLAEIQDEIGVGISGYLQEKAEDVCGFEVSVGDSISNIPMEALSLLFEKLKSLL
ncbi:aminotransferase class I/II-fold pyridoxal phosphate-dependent enzyme [Listeria seeligeri]|uniref:threonine aldolase family protein n=1 Tax=Listeria seeligeri TaxID=1640 RepID=UPI001623DD4D|nr:aminotransferase class I/II-fold pyridoxal phosphate-dependent enzyme [Listeria seeligeri]MBC2044299.1 aminotransferase class I/II-fold pyridoxal phosphate-dependent enzyme [Listeria seeligeri]MBC2051571.1 aminotransferase class I/II-fold pyridoxal phosphate-dependent enzyme [Listeria seeligeri]MBC2059189.1 aminotransferase class I/II-fold pyridoxal phosphate-dependent enzyme [Listeria seeligeri]MBC2221431.1 aminotransferase class I/II-fold pyridoxal phosphate-dependent enzyme [Listeria seel